MMNKLVPLLRSPYSVLFQRWKSVAIPSAITAFILYALQPLGISLKEGGKLGIAVGSGGITAGASVICHYLLPALLPSYYKEQHWTLGKYALDLLLPFFLIATGLWLCISWLSGTGMNDSSFLLVRTWAMTLAPFPLVSCPIWNRNMVLARNLKEAAEINSFLSRKMSMEGGGSSLEKKEEDTGRLVLSGGTKDVPEVSDCGFLYAEAEGNYVRMVFTAAGDGKPMRKLLCITMKQAEETVARCPFITRCHCAFLVNVQKVVEVYRNSQGCYLRLGGCQEGVPVFRACAKQVKALIEDRAQTLLFAIEIRCLSQGTSVLSYIRAACPGYFFTSDSSFMFVVENKKVESEIEKRDGVENIFFSIESLIDLTVCRSTESGIRYRISSIES